MTSAPQRMASTDALQIKDTGTSGKYFTRNHTVGKWAHTMVRPTVYKMRAFNPATGQFEFWLASVPAQGPPSGAAVTNKVIAAVFSDSFPPIA